MPRIQVVGVLFDLEEFEVYRLICRVFLEGLGRDYYVYVDRRSARRIDQLLEERPFRVLRINPSEGTSLDYAGDLSVGPAIDEAEEAPRDPWHTLQVLYLELRHERSRRKYRVEVPEAVIRQFHWLLSLTQHDGNQARAIIEA